MYCPDCPSRKDMMPTYKEYGQHIASSCQPLQGLPQLLRAASPEVMPTAVDTWCLSRYKGNTLFRVPSKTGWDFVETSLKFSFFLCSILLFLLSSYSYWSSINILYPKPPITEYGFGDLKLQQCIVCVCVRACVHMCVYTHRHIHIYVSMYTYTCIYCKSHILLLALRQTKLPSIMKHLKIV